MRTRREINSAEWFGEVPDGWNMVPLPRLFMSSKGMTVTRADLVDEGAPVVNYAQVHSKLNNRFGIHEELIKHVPAGMVPKGLKYSEKGSFIFACTSEDLAGCGDCIYNDSERPVNPGGDTLLLSPVDEVENKYLAYLFSTDMWRWQIRRDLVDVKVFHVNQGNLHETYVTVPPCDVQRRIVSYLDERCAAIDADIDKRREIIEKLKEYKKSLIVHAVTKGLDPNAEMKDSGVEWIGEVPAGWTVAKLSYFASSVLGKMIDRKQETSNNVHRYLSNRDVGWFSINVDDLSETSFPENSDARYGIEDGDVLICEGGEVGKCCVWRGPSPDFYFQKAIHRLRVNKKTAVPEYIAYQMLQKSIEGNFIEVRRGEATISHLPGDQLMMLKFILPPLSEQRRIVSYLDERRAAIDEAVSRQEQLIDKLGEYRKSIIHHAVTGKIDCTEA